jgi:hypothetical protein
MRLCNLIKVAVKAATDILLVLWVARPVTNISIQIGEAVMLWRNLWTWYILLWVFVIPSGAPCRCVLFTCECRPCRLAHYHETRMEKAKVDSLQSESFEN